MCISFHTFPAVPYQSISVQEISNISERYICIIMVKTRDLQQKERQTDAADQEDQQIYFSEIVFRSIVHSWYVAAPFAPCQSSQIQDFRSGTSYNLPSDLFTLFDNKNII